MGSLRKLFGWALTAGLLLSGCHSGTPIESVVLSEPPIVSGFPGKPPARMKSAVVWGNDERTVNSAVVWLQRQGVAVYGPGRVQEALARTAAKDNNSLVDEGMVLAAAKEAGTDAVVFSDRVGDSRPPMVSVRGIEAGSGRILWSGNARFGSFDQLPSNDSLSILTEQALMTAWGVRPAED